MDAENQSDAIWRKAARCGPIAAAMLLIATISAHAGAPAKPAPASPDSAIPAPWLLGDWGGERTKLQKQGVDFQAGPVRKIAMNAMGEPRRKQPIPTGRRGV
jgi:carbohydrate-selective porin OprB